MSQLYDLDKLREGLVYIETNIKNLEEALEKEKLKQAEYKKHILAAEAILEMHGENPSRM